MENYLKNLNDEEFEVKIYQACLVRLNPSHSIDVSDKIGYGKFDIEGIGQDKSWKEYLLKVDDMHTCKYICFDNSMLEKDVLDKIYKRFTEFNFFAQKKKYPIMEIS